MLRHDVVFLFDVDNTLLDNDHVTRDLKRHLDGEVGRERQEHYWTILEQLCKELGYVDYLGALQRYRHQYPRDPHLLTVSRFLVNYSFANRLFPNSLDAIEYSKGGDLSLFCRTATWSFSRGKSNDRGYTTRWTVTC